MKRYKEEYDGSLIDLNDPIPAPPTPTTTATIYIACSRNEETKAIGWAAVIFGADRKVQSLSGGELEMTICRSDVVALIASLKLLQEPTLVRLVTNSDYLFNGITKWIHGWVENGWQKIQHPDVWKQVAELLVKHTISTERLHPSDSDPLAYRCQQAARSKSAVASYY